VGFGCSAGFSLITCSWLNNKTIISALLLVGASAVLPLREELLNFLAIDAARPRLDKRTWLLPIKIVGLSYLQD